MPGLHKVDTAAVAAAVQLAGHQAVQAVGHQVAHQVAHLDGLHQATQAGIKLPESSVRFKTLRSRKPFDRNKMTKKNASPNK